MFSIYIITTFIQRYLHLSLKQFPIPNSFPSNVLLRNNSFIPISGFVIVSMASFLQFSCSVEILLNIYFTRLFRTDIKGTSKLLFIFVIF